MADNGYRDLAQFIIDNVGGKENIISVVHCTTRLRFKLKDEAKANDDQLKANDGIVTVVKSSGQYQVVIGTHVDKVYDDVLAVGGLTGGGQVADDYEDKSNMSLMDRFIDLISGIFTPFLGVMAAAGMIQGLTSAMGSFGWISTTSGTYTILYAIGNGFFYFLPIILGLTAARKFKVNEFIGIAIGAAMVYPNILSLYNSKTVLMTLFKGSIIESPIHATFLKIPVILMNYSSTVIPIVLAVWFASYVQKFVTKLIPGVVQLFLVPFFTLLITVPITFLVIGPVATWIADIIAAAIQAVINFSPILAAVIVGGFWQVLVMFGVHWGIVAAFYTELSSQGWDQMLLFSVSVCFSQIGVVTAIIFQTKNPKTKAIALPALISGIFGVTEPAIYGVTLPRKKSFILSCIGGAIGAIPFALGGVKAFSMAGMGVFAFPMVIGKSHVASSLIWWLISVIVSYLAGLLLQFIFGKSAVDSKEELAELQAAAVTEVGAQVADVKRGAAEQTAKEADEYNQPTKLYAPVNGQTLPLTEVKDEVFSSEAMGKGLAFVPSEGLLRAPADGTVVLVFPTGHAIGMQTAAGAEILMHIGMDTVNLQGKGFETLVEKGQAVKAGDPLVKFDLAAIKQAGYDPTMPMVVTNSVKYHEVKAVAKDTVAVGDEVLELS
ncbi:PTS beta-glucoside transporter subunit EIIBCA [Limosilactobacillus gastricus]|uniref:PTS system sucrose-specific EIIBCA component n=1 Tax=Limosilactobacillus gastricus DSM 16045 TaxID=1423749 RepID=A0A0R1VCM6_9LACO|nr:beta-glucoside-specific PTS transporter subunit IIABC [Limosilactobacillus gastricus]KRM03304.1 Protein-N(Pi)-phosphohistidine--sugar phosphotransferase [Limosilactobacillus gastricus DSM 16045]QGF41092.1 PTS beta-glucoside transporter subunit EIIBCA [Limosilactobacillus gastricus]